MTRLSAFVLASRSLLAGRLRVQSNLRHVSRGFASSRSTSKQTDPSTLLGVENVLKQASTGTFSIRPTINDEFSLNGRVGIVSGGNRGLGLEMSLALCELGARIYVLDLPKTPSDDFKTVAGHVAALGGQRTLEYISADVTAQKEIWAKVEEGKFIRRFDGNELLRFTQNSSW